MDCFYLCWFKIKNLIKPDNPRLLDILLVIIFIKKDYYDSIHNHYVDISEYTTSK